MLFKYRMVYFRGVLASVIMGTLVEAASQISACCKKVPTSLLNGSVICKPCDRYVFLAETVPEVKPCPLGQFLYRGKCRVCRRCGPGTGVKRRCKRDSDTVCKLCRKGTFSSKKSSTLPCRPCKQCDQHEKKSKDCRPSRDTVCKCQRGYFRSNYLGECWKCSYCFPEYPNLTERVTECNIEENSAEYSCRPIDRPPYIQLTKTDGVITLPEGVTVKTLHLRHTSVPGSIALLVVVLSVIFLFTVLLVKQLGKVARLLGRHNTKLNTTRMKTRKKQHRDSNLAEITSVIKKSEYSPTMPGGNEKHIRCNNRQTCDTKINKNDPKIERRLITTKKNPNESFETIPRDVIILRRDNCTDVGKAQRIKNITNVRKHLLVVNNCDYSSHIMKINSNESVQIPKSLENSLQTNNNFKVLLYSCDLPISRGYTDENLWV